jgi:hypothetical protein
MFIAIGNKTGFYNINVYVILYGSRKEDDNSIIERITEVKGFSDGWGVTQVGWVGVSEQPTYLPPQPSLHQDIRKLLKSDS